MVAVVGEGRVRKGSLSDFGGWARGRRWGEEGADGEVVEGGGGGGGVEVIVLLYGADIVGVMTWVIPWMSDLADVGYQKGRRCSIVCLV